jgi:uncharacterized protein YcaQ
MTMRLTRDEARWLAVVAQGLDRRPRGKPSDARVLETIRSIACLQLDTISVVARSHETVLFSRLGQFDPASVWRLFEQRALTEYWVHAAAIVPVESIPYFRADMALWRSDERDVGKWLNGNQPVVARVLETIQERGPVMSRDFERNGDRPDPWTWYGGKEEKQALDMLWTVGDLSIVGRKGFQRQYDLTERWMPAHVQSHRVDEAEGVAWLVRTGLSSLGITRLPWLRDYFRAGARSHLSIKDTARELDALVDRGEAIRVEVAGWSDAPVWLDTALLPRLEEMRAGRGRPTLTTILSPFDSLVWHRERLHTLFDMEYLIEVYTPEPKRVYGYYSLPILHRGRMIGRIDLHYARKARLMTIRAVHLEPQQKPTPANAAAVALAVREYLHFLGGGEIVIARCAPEAFMPLLADALGAA